uniref:Ubiquinol oxidase n=1 Tax=Odontella aurita TaxID=265563 RepID=A0A7S4MGU0_9STRA|mmetsp:Transcript_21236/g.61816  ORF Transcript_21236/g.61816 Transcript_21236/m.61816 type:complete len:563 (+) Transcript_21236:222-1910(+)
MIQDERPSCRKAALLAAALATSTTSPYFANGFSPSPRLGRSGFGVATSDRLRKTERFSTVSPDARKDTTITALEKLLEKQRADMRETETLIQKISSSDGANATEAGDMDDISSLKASGFGSSILAGVDYGFVSRSEGAKFDEIRGGNIGNSDSGFDGYGPPANLFKLGSQQFWRNLDAMKGEYKDEVNVNLTPKQRELQAKLQGLTLNSTAIWERERARGPTAAVATAPLVIKIPYLVLCTLLDVVFEGRYPPARFFLLETVARMPYFSYITMLHLYETLGFWRRSSDVKRVHFAEEWNEYHHLLIMESLGGDQAWAVRFLAQHSAVVYYIVLCLVWSLSPSLSYTFSEMLETHAVDTYGQFVDENEKLLKDLPPSLAAIEYYSFGSSDPFFGEYQTSSVAKGTEVRKPGENMKSLYDVFSAIREDEGDHVGTMKACLDPNVAVNSPAMERRFLTGVAFVASVGYLLGAGDLSEIDGVNDVVGSMGDLLTGSTDDATSSAIGSFIDNVMGSGTVDEGAEGTAYGLFSKFDLDMLGDLNIDVEVLSNLKAFAVNIIELISRLF